MNRRWIAVFFVCGGLLHAQSLEEAIARLRSDIAAEQAALTAERERIGAERRALHALLAERQQALDDLRDEVENLRRLQRQDSEEARRQREDLQAARQELAQLRALATEGRRNLESLVPAPLQPDFRAAFEQIDASLRENQPEAVASALSTLMSGYMQALELTAAPRRIEATVLGADGLERRGQILMIGPLAWLPPDGLLYADTPLSPLRLIPHAFSTVGPNLLPVDPSGGKALTLGNRKKSLMELLQAGGLTMIPLGLTAIAAVLLTILKAFSLLRIRGRDPARVEALVASLRAGELDRAAALASSAPEPLRTLLAGAVAHPHASAEELEEILHERMLGLMPLLDRHLGTLAVLGGVAPLLGLLGTVTGMITTFELVTLFGSGNERILSQGISEALVTTMTGLVIAVPVLLAHAFLARRVRVIVGELEQSIAALVRGASP